MEDLDKWNPMAEDFRDHRINSYREGVGQDLQNRDISDVEKKSSGGGSGYKPVTLYVKNIPLDVDETVLENLFLQQGKVMSVKIPEISQENVSKFKAKIGFVTMENAKGAQAAIENLDGFLLKSKHLGVNVKLSKDEMQRKKDAQMRNEQLMAACTSGRINGATQQSLASNKLQNEGAKGRASMNAADKKSVLGPAPANSDLQITLQTGSRKVHNHSAMDGGQPMAAPALLRAGSRGRGNSLNVAPASVPGNAVPPPSVIGSDDGSNTCATCHRYASQRCQACKSVYYCSVACQTQNWPQHRKVCVYEQRIPAAPVVKAPLLPEPDFDNMEVNISDSFINNNKEYLREWIMENNAARSESSGSSGGHLKQRPVFYSTNRNKPRDQGQRTTQRDCRQQEETNNTPPQPFTNNKPFYPRDNSAISKPSKQDQGSSEQPGGQAKRENRPNNSQQGGNNRSGPPKRRGGGPGFEGDNKDGGSQQKKGGDQSGGWKRDGHNQLQKDGNVAGQGKKQGPNFQDKGNKKKQGWEKSDQNKQRAGPKQQEVAPKSQPQEKVPPPVSSPLAAGTSTHTVKTASQPLKTASEAAAKTSNQPAVSSVKSSPAGGACSQTAVDQPASSFPGSDLELNKQIQVVVCYMESPQSFWVQEIENFREVMTAIGGAQQSYDGKGQTVSKVRLGQKFFCEYLGELARCRVEKVSGNSVTIFYIDYGNTEVTEVSNLLPLPAEIAELPVFTIHCSLQVVPVGGHCWPEEVLEKMKQNFNEAVCHMTPLRRVGTMLEVALVHTTDELNATDFLISEGLGLSPTSQIASVPAMFTSARVMASSLDNTKDTLSVGQRVDLVIVDTSSPLDIFTRISNLEPHFNNISNKMESEYNASPGAPYKPVVGELVVCRFSANRSWYRAKVLNVAESAGQVSLLYIDFGNTETLPFSEVRAVKPEYASVPVYGFHTALGGFKPPGGQWNEEHRGVYATCLKKYLMEQENDYPRCTVMVELVGSGEEGVVWVDMVKDGLQTTLSEDLSQQLDGSRLPQPLLPQVLTPTEPASSDMPVLSPVKPNEASPKSHTSPKASGNSPLMSVSTPPKKSTVSDSESSPKQNQAATASPSVPPLASRKESPFLLKKATLKLDVTVECGIQEIVSSQEFYINLKEAEEELNALREELNGFCSRDVNEDGPQPLKAVMLNDLVLVEFSADKEWYRGRVDRVLDGGKRCQVFFLDYGNIEEKDVSELKALPQNLRSQPAQAIACKLAGVMPPVSAQVEARFKSTFLQTEVKVKARGVQDDTYIVDVITADDRSVTSILDVQSVGRRGVARSNKPTSAPTSEELPALAPTSPVAQSTVSQPKSGEQPCPLPVLATPPKTEGSRVLMRDSLRSVALTAALNAVVTHVVTPHHFYIVTADQNMAQHGAGGLQSELQALNTPSKPLDHVPVVGELLCGLFYDVWYRCEVIEIMVPKVRVFFFDYGNEEMLDLSNLAILPHDLCNKYPLGTFRCSLHGIKPSIGQDNWDEETIELTKRLLENQVVSIAVRSQHGDVRHVLLSDPASGEDIGQMLVDCGKAVAVDQAELRNGGDSASVTLTETMEKSTEGTEVNNTSDNNPTKEAILRQMEALKAQLAAME